MNDEVLNFSIDGLKFLGGGNNSNVYLLDDDKIVKLYKSESVRENEVRREFNNARTAFNAGIPTPQVFRLVKVGNFFGLIFERVVSPVLGDYVRENPSRAEIIAAKEAALLKRIHSVALEPGSLPYFEQVYRSRTDSMHDLLTDEEISAAHKVIDSLPLRNTYLHGDCHLANIMLRDGELILVDMVNSSLGHPMYDLMSVYMFGIGLAKNFPSFSGEMTNGWSFELTNSMWQTFKRKYFGTDDPRELAELEDMAEFYSLLRWLTYLKRFPFPHDEDRRRCVEILREKFFPFVDENIPRFAEKIRLMSV